MSNKGKWTAAIVALAVMLLGVWWWRGGEQPGTTSSAGQRTGSGSSFAVQRAGAKDPNTGVPRWFGQAGAKGRRIAGVVIGEDRAPLRGATVRLASMYSAAGLVPWPSKVTDEAGRFDFGPQPASMYVVTAEAPKLTAAYLRVDLRDPGIRPASDQLRLVVHACTTSIHGTVYDMAGGPIGGALITRSDGSTPTKVAVEADDSGAYEVCLPAGGAGVIVSADGYAAVTERANVFGRTRRDFRLSPGASVIGRVVRASDKSAVEGAMVELRSGDPRSGETPQSTATDADGKFQFDAAAPGRLLLTAVAEGLTTRGPVDGVVEIGAAPQEIVIEVAAALSVSGTVIERGSGKPAAARQVYLVSREQKPNSMRPPVAMSQEDGSFVISHVLPGEYTPMLSRDRREAAKVTVATADVTGIVLEADGVATIAGRIAQGGKPVDGATVRAQSDDSQFNELSEADGGYLLRNVEPGTYTMYAQSNRVGAFATGQSITVVAGDAKTGVDLELDLAGSIAGVVVDQNDAPVAGVFLSFSLRGGRDFGSATTADDGSFTAQALSGGGDYLYEVRQRDQSPLVYPPATGKRHPPVTVKVGGTHITGVRVRIKYERLAITGRVTDAAGKVVADAKVTADPKDEGWFRVPSASSDQDGAFTIPDLPAGTYIVQAVSPRGEARAENVAAGQTNVVLKMLEGGGIDGTLVNFTGTPNVVARRTDNRYGRDRTISATVTGTTFQLRNLVAGRYQITATAGAESDTVGVDVAAGNIRAVKLEIGEVGTLTGTIVDDNGAPIAGMHCVSALQRMEQSSFDTPRQQATSDERGTFRIERVPVGSNMIGCYGENRNAWKQVDVAAGQVVQVALTATKRTRTKNDDDGNGRSTVGLTLEDQFDEVLVKAVEPGSIAARAGILAGDVIVSVDNQQIGRYESYVAHRRMEYERPDGEPVKVVLERNDKPLTVMLKRVK